LLCFEAGFFAEKSKVHFRVAAIFEIGDTSAECSLGRFAVRRDDGSAAIIAYGLD